MLAEGLHIYFMVVRVFDSGRGRKLYYLLIGWGKVDNHQHLFYNSIKTFSILTFSYIALFLIITLCNGIQDSL